MFNAISDPVLQVALWAGLIALALTAVMALAIVLLRLALLRDQQRWDRFVQTWRPLLLALMMDDEVAASDGLPPLLPRDRQRFLRLWVYLHESVRGEAGDRLNVAARHLGMDATARRLLRRGSRAARLQAVLALGFLRDAQAWDGLVRLASAPDPLVSINAARALVQIDAIKAADILMPLVLSRVDWDIARVAGMLTPSMPGATRRSQRQLQASSGLLFDVLQRYDPNHLLLAQAVREVFEAQMDVQALAAALARCAARRIELRQPRTLTPLSFPLWAETVRGELSTEDWSTRVRRAAEQLQARHG